MNELNVEIGRLAKEIENCSDENSSYLAYEKRLAYPQTCVQEQNFWEFVQTLNLLVCDSFGKPSTIFI